MVLKKLLSKSFLSTILLVLILLLSIFKNYVWLPFRTGTGEVVIQEYNFLSTTILGYGLYFPLIVFIVTMGLLFLSISKFFIPPTKRKSDCFMILTVIDIVSVIFPVLLGMQIFNIGLSCILALLICNLILSLYHKNEKM